jgi:putative oxidoreductase
VTKRLDVSALVLRVVAGLVFLPHGYSKVFGGGIAAFAADMPSYGIPRFLGYIVPCAELFGAALLIFGLVTRLDAFLLACTMFVAAFVVQLPDALREAQPGTFKLFAALHGIELPLALLAMSVAILIIGPGRYSLDSLLRVEHRVGSVFRRTSAGSAATDARVL